MNRQGSLSKNGGASSNSVMSSANIRVKVPSEAPSYTGSNNFYQSRQKEVNKSDEGSDSSEEEMF